MGVVRRNVTVDDDEDEEREVQPTARPAAVKVADLDDDGLDDEDEDEHTGRSTAVLEGRAGARKIKSMSSSFANEFKFEKGQKHLIRFLQDEQFASFRQHWVEKKGKKSYICIGKGCPLCAAGERASGKFAYNIWDYDQGEVKALVAGPLLVDKIDEEAEGTKTGKLSGYYWKISRTGKGSKTSYGFDVVKERDLEEDFGISPEDAEAAIEGAELYKASIFKVPSLSELRGVARELAADPSDDDDDEDDE